MPKGGHAVTTISGVSGDGLGFRKENFIEDTLPSFFRSVNEISFARKSPMQIQHLLMETGKKLGRGCRLAWSRLGDLGSLDPGPNPGSPTKPHI